MLKKSAKTPAVRHM